MHPLFLLLDCCLVEIDPFWSRIRLTFVHNAALRRYFADVGKSR